MLSFMIQLEDTTEIYINELLKVPRQNPDQQTSRSQIQKSQVILQHTPQLNKNYTTNF